VATIKTAHCVLLITDVVSCVDNKANNSNAVRSWRRRYPGVTANEECARLSATLTVALMWSYVMLVSLRHMKLIYCC